MDYSRKSFFERRPQRLCLMCGRCCRFAVASVSHEELMKKVEEGDKSAIEFIETFEPYESYEEALKLDEATVKNIPDYKNRTFYKCRFIKDGSNLCPRYEERYEVCRQFPSSPWAVTPPGCGFEGWLFQEREAHKKYIRKLKEDAIYYKAMLQTDISDEDRVIYEKLISKTDDMVKLYSQYEAEDW